MAIDCEESEARLQFGESINDYELRRELGIGSFGRVFEAFCVSNRQLCAVKVINIRKANLEKVDRINAEISVHLRLKHDNVCELYAVFQDEANVYLVLELCWGTLSDFLKMYIDHNYSILHKNDVLVNANSCYSDSHLNKHKHSLKASDEFTSKVTTKHILPFTTIRRIIKQICAGLSYLHRNCIIHRDLNLKNVLLKLNPFEKQDFVVKIADFGLAFDMTINQTGKDVLKRFPKGKTICGTPGYISPEVWSQNGVSAASDLFSIGSILFALATGVTPRGELDLRGMNPLLADLVAKLLNSEPSKRITIDDILSHPLISGELSTSRLSPVSKSTKTLQLTLTVDGDVKIAFLKSSCLIEVSGSKDSIVVHTKNKKSSKFTFETLPTIHWKKFVYVWRFVDLLKSRTPKVILNLHSKNEVRCTARGNLTVIKCCLMENNAFEATLLNSENDKLILNSQCIKSKEDVDLMTQLKHFRENCVDVEKRMKSLEDESGIDSLPVVIGRKVVLKKSEETRRSDLSVTINGIGSVSLKSDGVFKVDFCDGTSIITGDKYPIVFQSPAGETKSFNTSDVLPKYVLQKLSLVPKAIEELRKKSLLTPKNR